MRAAGSRLGRRRFACLALISTVHDGIADIDRTDVELADWQEARLVAIQHAGAISKDDSRRLALGEDWRMDVTDETGLILFQIDFSVMTAPVLFDNQS